MPGRREREQATVGRKAAPIEKRYARGARCEAGGGCCGCGRISGAPRGSASNGETGVAAGKSATIAKLPFNMNALAAAATPMVDGKPYADDHVCTEEELAAIHFEPIPEFKMQNGMAGDDKLRGDRGGAAWPPRRRAF
jgi:hypothetical protein